MVRHPLQRGIRAAIINPGDAGAGHECHIGAGAELIDNALCPLRAARAIHFQPLAEQAPAKGKIFLRQHYPRPGAGGVAGGHKTSGARTNDENIAKRESFFINIRVFHPRAAPQTSRATDQGFVKFFPETGGPHEGFIIESRHQQRRKQLVNAEQVKIQRWPAVLAIGAQPVIKFRGRGPRVGFAPRAIA